MMGSLLRLLRPYRWSLAVGLGGAILAEASSVALTGTAAWLISTAATQVPIFTLLVAIVMVRTFGISRGVLRYVEKLASHNAVLKMLGDTRSRVTEAVAHRIRQGRIAPDAPDLLARVTADVDDLQDAVIRGVFPYLTTVLVAGGAVLASALILPVAAVALAIGLALACAVLPLLTAAATARREAAAVAIRARRDALLAETMGVLTDLTATGQLAPRLAELKTMAAGDAAVRRNSARAAGWALAAAITVAGCASLVALATGAPATAAGQVSPAYFCVLVLLPLGLTDLMAAAGDAGSAIGRTRAAALRVLELLAEPTEDGDGVAAGAGGARVGGGEGGAAGEAVVVAGGAGGAGDADGTAGTVGDVVAAAAAAPVIELRDVHVRWPGSDHDVLQEISLTLHVGERIAVLGPSGSGKSTLAAVLLGLLPIRSGQILIHGHLAPATLPRSYTDQVSWADQSPHLFDSTIGRNIALARPHAQTAEIQAACAAAGLAEWIDGLPDGLDTRVGDGGLAVSGGERQRIALARALLANRRVLIADEVAAHLDPATAQSVTDSVLTPNPHRCTVLITHRIADTTGVDQVIHLRAGRITEHTVATDG